MSKLTKTQAKVPTTAVMAPASSHFQTRPFGLETEPTQPVRPTSGGHSFGAVRVHRNAPLLVQPKLKLGPAKDKFEEEADHMAAQVIGNRGATTLLHHKNQPISVPTTASVIAPDVEAGIRTAQGIGQSLPNRVRTEMEQAFGTEFRGVRIHTDTRSDQLNQALQARAFTTGRDIFWRRGEYNPNSRAGRTLLAHELTHIVQQGQAAQVIQRWFDQDGNLYSGSQPEDVENWEKYIDEKTKRERWRRKPTGVPSSGKQVAVPKTPLPPTTDTKTIFLREPTKILFSQDTISPIFEEGKGLNILVNDLVNGKTKPENVEEIRLVSVQKDKGWVMVSLDNRRLYAFRQANQQRSAQKLSRLEIRCRWATTSEQKKEGYKFSAGDFGANTIKIRN